MENVQILFVDDEKEIVDGLNDYFKNKKINNFTINSETETNFDNAINLITEKKFDIIILDLCKGNSDLENADKIGLEILKKIQDITFIPIIFYTAIPSKIVHLKSLVVSVIDKLDNIENLNLEIENLIKSNLFQLKDKLKIKVDEEFKNYFWDVIHKERNKFNAEKKIDHLSLGYIILKRLANNISKLEIKKLLNDNSNEDKINPIEYYHYPVSKDKEFEAGDIISIDEEFYILLTPDCDYILRKDNTRKAEKILLAKLTKNPKNFEINRNILMKNNIPRYFFLPKTPFIEELFIDFQDKKTIEYNGLLKENRICKLEIPIAQEMIVRFTNYYNRIGIPELNL